MDKSVTYFNDDRDRYVDKETVKTVSKELSRILTKQVREAVREGQKAN